MMVLLEKHVHLQKEGGAERLLATFEDRFPSKNWSDCSPSANTERKRAQSASSSTRRRGMIKCCEGGMIVGGLNIWYGSLEWCSVTSYEITYR